MPVALPLQQVHGARRAQWPWTPADTRRVSGVWREERRWKRRQGCAPVCLNAPHSRRHRATARAVCVLLLGRALCSSCTKRKEETITHRQLATRACAHRAWEEQERLDLSSERQVPSQGTQPAHSGSVQEVHPAALQEPQAGRSGGITAGSAAHLPSGRPLGHW